MVSPDERSFQILTSWQKDSTRVNVTFECSGVAFSGTALVSRIDLDGVQFTDPGKEGWTLFIPVVAGARGIPTLPPGDPPSVAIRIRSGPTDCLLLGPLPKI